MLSALFEFLCRLCPCLFEHLIIYSQLDNAALRVMIVCCQENNIIMITGCLATGQQNSGTLSLSPFTSTLTHYRIFQTCIYNTPLPHTVLIQQVYLQTLSFTSLMFNELSACSSPFVDEHNSLSVVFVSSPISLCVFIFCLLVLCCSSISSFQCCPSIRFVFRFSEHVVFRVIACCVNRALL